MQICILANFTFCLIFTKSGHMEQYKNWELFRLLGRTKQTAFIHLEHREKGKCTK